MAARSLWFIAASDIVRLARIAMRDGLRFAKPGGAFFSNIFFLNRRMSGTMKIKPLESGRCGVPVFAGLQQGRPNAPAKKNAPFLAPKPFKSLTAVTKCALAEAPIALTFPPPALLSGP
jgi:hypothetical protein